MSLRVLELFSGGGGASLGLHAAGFQHLLGVDAEEIGPVGAVRRALGFASLTARVDPVELMRFRRQVDLLWGSPSCQLFSSAQTWKPRDEADLERNAWPVTLDTVRAVAPTWCIFENVGGAQHYVDVAVLPTLRTRYACVEARVLDAQFYGVPQTRRRLFVVAGSRPFRWPAPATPRPQTMGEALPWLRDRQDPRNTGLVYHLQGRGGTEPERLDRPAPTVTTMEEKGTRASASSRWTFHGGPDRASDAAFLATGRRRLEWTEVARLQAWPQGAIDIMADLLRRRTVTVHTLYLALGNSVPPPMAAALGHALRASAG